jgi:hypothetical protein
MSPYEDKDLVVVPEGALFRVIRSCFHCTGDLLTKPVFDAARSRTTRSKVLVLPEGSAG